MTQANKTNIFNQTFNVKFEHCRRRHRCHQFRVFALSNSYHQVWLPALFSRGSFSPSVGETGKTSMSTFPDGLLGVCFGTIFSVTPSRASGQISFDGLTLDDNTAQIPSWFEVRVFEFRTHAIKKKRIFCSRFCFLSDNQATNFTKSHSTYEIERNL